MDHNAVYTCNFTITSKSDLCYTLQGDIFSSQVLQQSDNL